ncbi:hypothetical protein D3C85_1407980 [compost metagenome]
MQAAHPLAQLRQVLAAQLAVGAAIAAEAVLRRTLGIDADHGQGGRRVAGDQVIAAHPFLGQHPAQAGAEVVAGNTAEQRRVAAEAAQTERHVERRAAGQRLERQLAAARAGLKAEEIEQGFATNQIHN